MDRLEQRIGIDRFGEEGTRTTAHRGVAGGNARKGGDDDHRLGARSPRQFGLKLDPRHARHVQVGDDARDIIEPVRCQHVLRRGTADPGHPGRAQQAVAAAANARIVAYQRADGVFVRQWLAPRSGPEADLLDRVLAMSVASVPDGPPAAYLLTPERIVRVVLE